VAAEPQRAAPEPPAPTSPAPAAQQPTAPARTSSKSSDSTPPANVRVVKVTAGDRFVELTWRLPSVRDFDRVVVVRSMAGKPGRSVYRGRATRFRDRGVANGVEYRYRIVSYDRAGNRSAGVDWMALPKAILLLSPKDKARLVSPPLLRWVPVRKAGYFNVQLFLGKQKVYSAWPTGARLQLTASWVFGGRAHRLTPGTYRWFVWPGYGKRAAVKYGAMLGESSFVVAKGPRPPD